MSQNSAQAGYISSRLLRLRDQINNLENRADELEAQAQPPLLQPQDMEECLGGDCTGNSVMLMENG